MDADRDDDDPAEAGDEGTADAGTVDETAADLGRRTWELLQPGEIDLDGLVVSTALAHEREPEMHQLTVEVGDLIAGCAGVDPAETFVYSGTDDPEFASNQHQGLTLADESFVWECQQLYREGSYEVVFYFEASIDTDALLEDLEGYDVTYVRGAADDPREAVLE